MHILVLRTDKPESEIGLYDDWQQLAYEVWHAHRTLAETLHSKLQTMLEAHGLSLAFGVSGIVVYQGPGSFTGLRIGLTTANALAYSYGIPVVAINGGPEPDNDSTNWQQEGIGALLTLTGSALTQHRIVTPFYGSDVRITAPKR